MKQFFGLCLLLGTVKLPSVRDFFSNNPLYFHPIAKQVMSGRRFEQLLNCFSVEYTCENLGENIILDGTMKKISPLFDILIKNFQNALLPDEQLSLDESLLLHRGRLSFRQYIKYKKARYGIKFYELCTPDGYVLNIEMYKGKTNVNATTVDQTSKIDSLVLRLTDPYLDKGHCLFMDNYYNSFNLLKKFFEKQTHTTGTLRNNRKGNPKQIINKKIKKGEHIWKQKQSVYVSKWKDKRDVLCITTKYQPSMLLTKNRFGQEKVKPVEISKYNEYMSGIDRADQMVNYYSSPRKTLKWYKKVLFHLLDITIWNTFYLYKKHFKCYDMRFKEFRDLIIKNFLQISPTVTATELFCLKNKKKIRK